MKQSEKQAGHIKQLEWAVSFCQADLETFREGDWLNARDSMYDFVNFGNELTPIDRKDFVRVATDKEIGNAQADINRQLMNLAVDPREPNAEPIVYGNEVDVMLTVSGSAADQPFAQIVDYELRPSISVTAALYSHLVFSGIARGQLRVCPECGRIFLYGRQPRADKQLHCSLKCSRLAATHRFREKKREELKPKERERSHQRYVRKQRLKFGPKTKVERRERKKGKGRGD